MIGEGGGVCAIFENNSVHQKRLKKKLVDEEPRGKKSSRSFLFSRFGLPFPLLSPLKKNIIRLLWPMTHLSVVTAIRWHTIDAEIKRDISSSARQTADWRITLHVINIGTATTPVSRSDEARLHSSKLVIDRRCFFLASSSKTKPFIITTNTARTIEGISAAGSKYWCISPLNPLPAKLISLIYSCFLCCLFWILQLDRNTDLATWRWLDQRNQVLSRLIELILVRVWENSLSPKLPWRISIIRYRNG